MDSAESVEVGIHSKYSKELSHEMNLEVHLIVLTEAGYPLDIDD